MKRLLILIAALVAALLALPGLAATIPQFDATAHPYVKLATTDKAIYAPGGSGNILVTLRNPGGSSFAATVVTSIYLDTTLVVPATTSTVTVPAGGTAPLSVPFTIPNAGERGYRVDVTVKDGGGTVVDDATTAIDVQKGLINARFPRQCWISHWDGSVDAASLIASQVAWHCNTVQGYALYYRPELAPPANLASWPTLSNLTVSRATIHSVITAAHAANMPVGFFQATGEAYSDWNTRNTGPSLSMGSFLRKGTLLHPLTVADLDRSPPTGQGWNEPPQNYGWQANYLALFDLCNAGWRRTLIVNSIRPMLKQFPFDFWQADTLGAPAATNYDARGNVINTGACLSDFTSEAQSQLGKPVIVNTVSGWNSVDVALTGTQPYQYRETWNFDTPSYPGLNAIIAGSAYGLRRYSSRAFVQPAYLQRTLSENCSNGTQTVGCTANPNSPLLATAMFAISGSTLMNHQDDGCIMTNVFVEGYHLPCSSALTDKLLAYKAFEVGYQNLLRDGVSDSVEPCVITGGAVGGTTGAAGQVYVLGKTKAGHQVCHLLNLTGVASNDWTDLNGTKETPAAQSSIGMKLYYFGNPVVSGTNKLWWSSPDVAAGAAQALTYTTGSDGSGNYVAFTVPSLSYWDVVTLETSLADPSGSIDARQPIRGAWFGPSSGGISPAGTLTTASCCSRWAGYLGVQFTTTAVNSVSITYTAPNAASLKIRLDGPAGAVMGDCPLPAASSPTVSPPCPVRPITGLHDVYVEFGKTISLNSFTFAS